MKISGFTFVHNALTGGYPIAEAVTAVRPYVDEVVAVDIHSDDGTTELLHKLGCKVLPGEWYDRDTTAEAFKQHVACEGDIIIFFEADEVFDDKLLGEVGWALERGQHDIAVYRLQVTQNFQRVKWWPIRVHRIFPKGGGTYHLHPTNCPDDIFTLPPTAGYMWDCSNCFRDNWQARKRNQVKFFGCDRPLYVPEHFLGFHEFLSEADEAEFMEQPFWTWTATPLAIPEILRPLLGKTKYEVNI